MLGKLSRAPGWMEVVTGVFSTLPEAPARPAEVPALCHIEAIGIPEARGGFRPACLREAALGLFRRLVIAGMHGQRMMTVCGQLAFRQHSPSRQPGRREDSHSGVRA